MEFLSSCLIFVASMVTVYSSYVANERTNRINQEMNQKKIDADIIAKSRIHWIETTQEITALFLSNTQGIIAYLDSIRTNTIVYKDNLKKEAEGNRWLAKEKNNMDIYIKTCTEEVNSLMTDNYKLLYNIRLKFSPTEEHEEIFNKSECIYISLTDVIKSISESEFDFEESNDCLKEEFESIAENTRKMAVTFSRYFKNEWEKAKKGE